jgi:glycosyltransferase involved in cell wall biosynthesis
MKRVKKVLKVIKQNGLINGTRIVLNKIKNMDKNSIVNFNSNQKDLFEFYNYLTFQEKKSSLVSKINSEKISILWFIPDFGIGSGGHMNIFRMIYNLERLGIESDIAICGQSQWIDAKIAIKIINEHFFQIKSNVFMIDKEEEIDKIKAYDIAMATSWQTAYYVRRFEKCYKKTYFVQDFEPYFYAHGSSYVFAENTYYFGFIGISAGSWISEKLKNEYKMECFPFSFSYDRELYFKHKKVKNKRRVFFYARPPTERRAFELGMLSLKKISELNPDVKIIFAGWDVSEYKINFPHFNAGVVSINELSNLYSQCDVALVLSFTNLSLLPLELLASGCPIVSNNGTNNSWIDKDKRLFIYAENTVEDITKKINDVLNKNIDIDFEYIDNFLNTSSWENEAYIVKQYLENIIQGDC